QSAPAPLRNERSPATTTSIGKRAPRRTRGRPGRAKEEVALTTRLRRLRELGSAALVRDCDAVDLAQLTNRWSFAGALADVLNEKNGFYAFESSLLVRPLNHARLPVGLLQWNDPSLWKQEYPGTLEGMLCFAEDAFGNQFALGGDDVFSIDSETGEAERIAGSLEQWARLILDDCNYRTGCPLAHEWQLRNGPLEAGQRILPKIPFVTGGAFETGNLRAISDVEGMRFRGAIARQIRDVPDGGQVVFRVKP